MRQEVTGETNKIESYHAFTKWLNFGGDVITENDPVEQQKRLRYIDLVAGHDAGDRGPGRGGCRGERS